MRYRKILARRHGGPEALELVEDEMPTPRSDQALVRVLAAGVGFPDLLMREGTYPGGPRPPFTPGYDLVGVVEDVGDRVTLVHPGDLVAALTVHGSYSELVCLAASELVPVPEGVDAAEAVSVVLNYTTAYQMLHRSARAQRGELLLVHGAAGGVGTASLQLGRLAGLELYGTSSAAKSGLVRELGATPIDYRTADFAQTLREAGGADVVLDGIGGRTSLRSYRSLGRGGLLVLFGHLGTLVNGRRSPRAIALFYAAAALALAGNLLPDGRRVVTYQVAKLKERHPAWFREDLSTLFGLLADGSIKPLIAARLPLEEARRAHELLARGEVEGKLVLTCGDR
jgi:NADPH2:quinone reductase